MTKDVTRGVEYRKNDEGQSVAGSIVGSLKMDAWDYLAPLSPSNRVNQICEVQFKNTHKGYYLNPDGLNFRKGDIVVVESHPGIDIGVVTLEEDMVRRKMRCTSYKVPEEELKKVLRFPTSYDIDRWKDAIALEQGTMIKSRQIAADLGLEMKIGDVEYQADRSKAIFYYIADGRVDFRELIKVLAEQFRLRVEMKQIGARQEAGRIGGIGSCGRELCCSSWQSSFSSVSINAARIQDISPNPQKLAGQCGKLKCCLNYEVDVYDDARKNMPSVKNPLEALDGSYFLVKVDSLRRVMWFSTDPKSQALQIPISSDQVLEIVEMNRRGEKPESLSNIQISGTPKVQEHNFENVVGQDSLTRFDKAKGQGKHKNNKKNSPQESAQKHTDKKQKPAENNAAVQKDRQINSGNESQESAKTVSDEAANGKDANSAQSSRGRHDRHHQHGGHGRRYRRPSGSDSNQK